MKKIYYSETKYGFKFGSAEFIRIASDPKKGWVVIGLETPRYNPAIQIYVTKTGKVRIIGKSEWKEAR